MIRCARVQGYAVGGGLSLVLAVGMAIAAEGAVFPFPRSNLASPALWGSMPRPGGGVGAAPPPDAAARQKRLNGRPLRRTLAGTEDETALALGRA